MNKLNKTDDLIWMSLMTKEVKREIDNSIVGCAASKCRNHIIRDESQEGYSISLCENQFDLLDNYGLRYDECYSVFEYLLKECFDKKEEK